MLGTGIALGMILADLYAQGQFKVTPYWTFLLHGIAVRGRIFGRLYGVEGWREHRQDDGRR